MAKATTKKTTRRRTVKKAVVEADVQPVAVPEVEEAILASEAEPEPQVDSTIHSVYLVTRDGVEYREGLQAQPIIRQIRQLSNGDDSPFRFYEGGVPVYLAVRASEPRAMAFPDPGPAADEYGLTSIELYGLAVTLAHTISRIVELETRGKSSLMMEAKKIMTLALPIVAAVFVIFLMVVVMTG